MMYRRWSTSVSWNLFAAGCVRCILLFYGMWQDEVLAVEYTDIDYRVFTDAARYMTQGLSPYRRATYRYTPVIALLLQTNVWICANFGKFLFVLCDILAGYLTYKNVEKTDAGKRGALICTQLWLFNPLTMVVSTRGNAESVMAVLVVGMLYLLKTGKLWHTVLSAVLYGLSVHIKIYPAIYVVAIYMHINTRTYKSTSDNELSACWYRSICPTFHSIVFGLTSFITFISITAVCYVCYGDEFMFNTYLYHVTRHDIRHNFSVYFYFLYLTSTAAETSTVLALAAFVPQLLLVLLIAVKFQGDIEFACFLQTFIFVTFNKVCTSQYFLWYLCLLPLIVTKMKNGRPEQYFLLFVLWLTGQGTWLLPAYLLEFCGYNVYLFIWMAGLAFFIINIYISFKVLRLYQPVGVRVKLR